VTIAKTRRGNPGFDPAPAGKPALRAGGLAGGPLHTRGLGTLRNLCRARPTVPCNGPTVPRSETGPGANRGVSPSGSFTTRTGSPFLGPRSSALARVPRRTSSTTPGSWFRGAHRHSGHGLSRVDFGDLQVQQSPAPGTHQRSAVRHIDRRRVAPGAGHGGVGGFGQRLRRHGSGERSARWRGGRLESGPAVRAHVVETAVGRATVKHLRGTAHRAIDGELLRPHAISCRGRSTRGRRPAG